jgi:ketosteroid isomerase-like protein
MRKNIRCWLWCFSWLPGLALAASDKAALKAELVQTETDFCAMAQTQGLPAAFAHYAAEDAVFFDVDPKRHRGREAVRLRYADAPAGAVLTWKPVQADVADSGELGYTWGTYEFRGPPGPDGKSRVGTGHYVTIWKRQADGVWRFVLDTGNPNPPARK